MKTYQNAMLVVTQIENQDILTVSIQDQLNEINMDINFGDLT